MKWDSNSGRAMNTVLAYNSPSGVLFLKHVWHTYNKENELEFCGFVKDVSTQDQLMTAEGQVVYNKINWITGPYSRDDVVKINNEIFQV